jgi:hypothetical protein
MRFGSQGTGETSSRQPFAASMTLTSLPGSRICKTLLVFETSQQSPALHPHLLTWLPLSVQYAR